MMRKIAISFAAILTALVLAIYLWRFTPLLPERGAACFAANYDPPRPVDLSSPRRDRKSVGEVKSMRLKLYLYPGIRLVRRDSGRGYDRLYSLQLDAELVDGRNLSASASCEWSDTFVDRMLPALFCYIDCDGGSVSVFRQIGQSGVSAWFEPGERLRTGQSCDGGGGIFIGAEKEWRRLPMEAVDQQKCAG